MVINSLRLLLTLVAGTYVTCSKDSIATEWSTCSNVKVCYEDAGSQTRKICRPTKAGTYELISQTQLCNIRYPISNNCDKETGKCKQGWTGVNCDTDINECSTENGGCKQKCVNTDGSFKCECNKGFQMNSDGLCIATYMGDVKLTETELSELKDIFAKFDKDNSGSIDITELQSVVSSLDNTKPAERVKSTNEDKPTCGAVVFAANVLILAPAIARGIL